MVEVKVKCNLCKAPADDGLHLQINDVKSGKILFQSDFCQKHAKIFMNQTEKLVIAMTAKENREAKAKKEKQEG